MGISNTKFKNSFCICKSIKNSKSSNFSDFYKESSNFIFSESSTYQSLDSVYPSYPKKSNLSNLLFSDKIKSFSLEVFSQLIIYNNSSYSSVFCFDKQKLDEQETLFYSKSNPKNDISFITQEKIQNNKENFTYMIDTQSFFEEIKKISLNMKESYKNENNDSQTYDICNSIMTNIENR